MLTSHYSLLLTHSDNLPPCEFIIFRCFLVVNSPLLLVLFSVFKIDAAENTTSIAHNFPIKMMPGSNKYYIIYPIKNKSLLQKAKYSSTYNSHNNTR